VESAYTIVVPDADILSCVCGTNDSNLKLIEEHLGVPVFTRGNELSVDEEDPSVREKFRFIIDRILDEIQDGGGNSQDIVASVLNTEPRTDMARNSIVVPGGLRKIYPRTEHQAQYVEMLRKYDMVLCTGAAGSGKTFLAVAESLRTVLSHDKARLIVTRPVVEAGESLGYLPGDLEQKINPYLRPLYDAMEAVLPRETVRKLIESGVIETAPLAYMRGRTLNNSIIILDEGQNTTKEQMKMFLTRMGENAKVFITGDITQTDLPRHVASGLVHALKLLDPVNEIGKMMLTAEDVVRNPLVRKIVKAYENEEQEQNLR
jgi:phosphate starvation-inducible protein PhoH and related proteins